MFQNSYQNGTYFQLFDPKAPQDKVRNLYKLTAVHGNCKNFDKQLKTYIFQFNSPSAKISFPRDQKKQLYLIQKYLTLQIFLFPGQPWHLEFAISDLNKTKRRVIISSATHKVEKKTFFIKYPTPDIKEGVWTNICIDLFSFMSAFKGQTYRSLDTIHISGFLKLRRIFTCPQPTEIDHAQQSSSQVKPINFLPKNFFFPLGVESTHSLIRFQDQAFAEQLYQPTEASTKNCSKVRRHRQISTPKTGNIKTQKSIGYKKQKKFLANTNGPETMNRKKKKQADGQSSQQSRSTNKKFRTPGSTQKNIGKRKTLGKNNLNRQTSTQKKKQKVFKDKNKVKQKLNPWRVTHQRDVQTDGGSQFSNSKIEDQRNIQSAQTTLFKTKNCLVSKFNQSKNKGFERKSDHYSDSEYVELSQKFSTITDPKFFKNQLSVFNGNNQNQESPEQEQQQIEQNIELEANSMHSSNLKQTENHKDLLIQFKQKPVDESIQDSLDNFVIKQQSPEKKQMFMSSYYGFGAKAMNKVFNQIQRPYSPPLGQRQVTQQVSEHNEMQEKEVQLIYDPVLNCYYDHKTHTYYQLKN